MSKLGTDKPLSDSFRFGFDLYTTVLGECPDKNVIISPLSVQTALGLLLMGADGDTAKQIIKGLHMRSEEQSRIAAYFQEILEQHTIDGKLKIANKIYTKTGCEVNPKFDEVSRKQFKSEAESIDFTNADLAAKTISSWVETQTNNKIKDLMTADKLQANTRMVLVNAVHFKCPWETPFEKEYTKKDDFWVSETETVKVDMMFENIRMRYGKVDDLDAQIAMIPYLESDLSMMIILPNARDGLPALEDKLQNYDISTIPNNLHTRHVEVFLPKFKVESNIDLKTVLAKMGMENMFGDQAEFPSLLASDELLYVDDAVHKAYIAVDEEGTEAAAASGLNMCPMSLPPRIEVKHPFLFAIVSPHGIPFLGSVRKL